MHPWFVDFTIPAPKLQRANGIVWSSSLVSRPTLNIVVYPHISIRSLRARAVVKYLNLRLEAGAVLHSYRRSRSQLSPQTKGSFLQYRSSHILAGLASSAVHTLVGFHGDQLRGLYAPFQIFYSLKTGCCDCLKYTGLHLNGPEDRWLTSIVATPEPRAVTRCHSNVLQCVSILFGTFLWGCWSVEGWYLYLNYGLFVQFAELSVNTLVNIFWDSHVYFTDFFRCHDLHQHQPVLQQ